MSLIEPPSFVIVGSPGMTRMTTKMTTELSASSAMLVAVRLTMNRDVGPKTLLSRRRLVRSGRELGVLEVDVPARVLPDPRHLVRDRDDVRLAGDREERRLVRDHRLHLVEDRLAIGAA